MIISNSSSIPIYEQIKNSILEQIMNEELLEDEMLPSIRTLAADIKISVMTIKKAYDELESEGYIISRQGKGTFVAKKNTEIEKETARRKIEEYLANIVELSKKYNISEKEVIDALNIYFRSEK